MTSKMHRRNFVKGSLAMLAAGQEASLAGGFRATEKSGSAAAANSQRNSRGEFLSRLQVDAH